MKPKSGSCPAQPCSPQSSAFTCKSYIACQSKTPLKIKLLGQKSKPESAQHIVEFPGGAIEVSRTTDGNYWAHIIVNRDWSDNDCDGMRHSIGQIIGGRIDARNGVNEIPCFQEITQIALLIKPTIKPQ